MTPLPRCWVCRGSILAGSCISCGREMRPNLVTLAEALDTLATPEAEQNSGVRQQVPLSVSLERARLWSKGERA